MTKVKKLTYGPLGKKTILIFGNLKNKAYFCTQNNCMTKRAKGSQNKHQ